jgi:hypothetical protein
LKIAYLKEMEKTKICLLLLAAVEVVATAQAAEVHVVRIRHTRAEVGVVANLVPNPAQS